ncbi:type I restriction enzyme HsdR N-terminal domain-containing protein [Oryzicola mucosus]|uniref:Type I restriction enzyme HsdR N-terminal domain-containing protein n=1 Tax=Oryzicola mucosus TaxID=2767425 RepID=A0A8J6U375_9HYPH|nr:type I restriction enzyme HsdR N-terminal domain-containing protein [Oryzicola mucosus]
MADRVASNEATVEIWFVLPLLEALGHNPLHIDSKVAVAFQEGRKQRPGRKPEADFVVYAEKPFSRATSLIVVESKHPNEPLDDGKEQGESYAQNLRAPVLLLTNGEQLEVWQLQQTSESERIFSCVVADLAQHRGTLEALLSPEALRSHCRQLGQKQFDILLRDLGDYERAVHERASQLATKAIERRLSNENTQREHGSLGLLDLGGRGAIVTAFSGYGKTVLACSLLCEAIERRWTDSTQQLPIDVFAPDLVQSKQLLEAFLTNRIEPYKAGFSEARLREIARSEGLLVIVDGFERIKQSMRSWLEAQLRALLDGYPKIRVYVMSRSGVAPASLGLPLLTLTPYSLDELHNLARLRSRISEGVQHVFSGAPRHIIRLAEVPLVADLVLMHYTTVRSYPTDLSALFEGWLKQILADSDPVDRAFDRKLLGEIAAATVGGPLDISRAHEFAMGRPDPGGTLRRLVEQEAISIRGTNVELPHEALADHLRAVQFWSNGPSVDQARLDELSFDPSSQFALLLVSNAPSPDARGAAWQAIARQNLHLAIQSLRFAGFDRPFTGEIPTADGLRMARDIQSTTENLIASHLGPIAPRLRELIAGQPVETLGVVATLGPDDIGYAFFDAKGAADAAKTVDAVNWERAPRIYGHALRRMGFGPEVGRLLGVERVRNAVDELIDKRNLIGGTVWLEERSYGRLRHLVRRYGFSIDPIQFDQAIKVLEPEAGKLVTGSSLQKGQTFTIDELLADLRWLRSQGVTKIEQWWDSLDKLNLRDPDDQKRFGQTLDAYYRRRQIAYEEVVTHSIPAIRQHLPTLCIMPLRMEIVAKLHSSQGYESVVLNTLRWPVRTFDEAGADVTFSDERPNHNSDEAIERYVQRTDELLKQFGRYFNGRVITWGGSIVPDLQGRDQTFGKLPDESAVVSGAMSMLKEDLKSVFSEVPSGQWR